MNHCPHVDVVGIYGDMINRLGGRRLWCRDCQQTLDGPVSIADDRQRAKPDNHHYERKSKITPWLPWINLVLVIILTILVITGLNR